MQFVWNFIRYIRIKIRKEISTNPEGLQIAQGLYYLSAFFLHLWSDRAQVTVYMMKDVSTWQAILFAANMLGWFA